MSRNVSTIQKLFALSGAVLMTVMVATPSMAKSPYYFVDDAGNSKDLYTEATCRGAENPCVGFVHACGTDFYSSRYAQEAGVDTLRYKGKISIRQNSGNYEVVCTVTN